MEAYSIGSEQVRTVGMRHSLVPLKAEELSEIYTLHVRCGLSLQCSRKRQVMVKGRERRFITWHQHVVGTKHFSTSSRVYTYIPCLGLNRKRIRAEA
jgi:hypothetical protein